MPHSSAADRMASNGSFSFMPGIRGAVVGVGRHVVLMDVVRAVERVLDKDRGDSEAVHRVDVLFPVLVRHFRKSFPEARGLRFAPVPDADPASVQQLRRVHFGRNDLVRLEEGPDGVPLRVLKAELPLKHSRDPFGREDRADGFQTGLQIEYARFRFHAVLHQGGDPDFFASVGGQPEFDLPVRRDPARRDRRRCRAAG